MKTKRADINITFNGDDSGDGVDVVAVLNGTGMSAFDRDVETLTVLLMGVALVLGNAPLSREDFIELCGKAYDMNFKNNSRRERLEFPIDVNGLPN